MPTRYNDGASIEAAKFAETHNDLVERFGAVTYQPHALHGVWLHGGERFEDENVRIVVDVEDRPEHEAFFREFKERLKGRFRQIDVWIVSFPIQII